jgi:hypothetical protein
MFLSEYDQVNMSHSLLNENALHKDTYLLVFEKIERGYSMSDTYGRQYLKFSLPPVMVEKYKSEIRAAHGGRFRAWLSGATGCFDQIPLIVKGALEGGLEAYGRFLREQRLCNDGEFFTLEGDKLALLAAAIELRLGNICTGNYTAAKRYAESLVASLIPLLENTQLAFNGGTLFSSRGQLFILLCKETAVEDMLAYADRWDDEDPSFKF